MKPEGVIIAGGRAERMGGGEKPLLPFRGRPLVESVIECAAPQVSRLALNVRQASRSLYAGYEKAGVALLAESSEGAVGPLGGIAAALDWVAAQGANDWLATFPSDTPFLPPDLVPALMARRDGEKPVVAVAGGHVQSLCALWPVSCREGLKQGIEDGSLRSVWWSLQKLGAHECAFEDERPFFNINTRENLARAEALAAAGGQRA